MLKLQKKANKIKKETTVMEKNQGNQERKIRESDNIYFLLNQFPSTLFQFYKDYKNFEKKNSQGQKKKK